MVLGYWEVSGDPQAAKLIAYAAPPDFVRQALPALVDRCSEGWIIGRAAIRAVEIAPETLLAIRAKFPATFAYICAMTGRQVSHEEALAGC